MAGDERRRETRHNVKFPVKLRPTEGATAFMQSGETINVSERGVYFSADPGMKEGTKIELSFTLPAEITGGLPMKIRCTARVVRVDNFGQQKKVGLATHIERFETVVAEATN